MDVGKQEGNDALEGDEADGHGAIKNEQEVSEVPVEEASVSGEAGN